MGLNELLVPLGFFALVFGLVYLYITSRNKERMALIEKGASATLFNTGKTNGGFFGKLPTLKLGMFFIGIALGTLIGNILASTTVINEDVAYVSMIFLFGGLALVSYYLVANRIQKQD
jgi:hypothetical protein